MHTYSTLCPLVSKLFYKCKNEKQHDYSHSHINIKYVY
jgi:hypothetical protein